MSQCIVNLWIPSAPEGKNCCCYTKWLDAFSRESLVQNLLETVKNRLLAFIKFYSFFVHRMNILECVGQDEVLFSLWRRCYNQVRMFPINLFVIWSCYSPLFLPCISTECANFRSGKFCIYCHVFCRVVLT